MANSSWAAIDNNDKPTLTAVTDDSNQYIQRVLVDPASGRLLVSATGLGAPLTLQTNGTNNGSQSLLNLVAGTNMTITDNGSGSITFASTGGSSGITVNTTTITGGTTGQLVYDNGGTFGELTTATYPSITEISYVKGVTSAIQTQLNSKGAGTVTAIGVTTANGVSGTSSGGATPNLTITLGAITPTTVNGLTISTSTGTLQITNGKTLQASNSITLAGVDNKTLTLNNNLTFAGTDGTTMTFPSTSSTVMTLASADTITGVKTFSTAPVFNALPSGSAVSSSATASTLVARDANANETSNNFIEGFATTVTSGSTVTLTVASKYQQYFTGSTAQLVTLPTTSVVQGQTFQIVNQSSAVVTVQSSGANIILAVPANTTATFTALVATPTTAANWSYSYAPNVPRSKNAVVSPTYTLNAGYTNNTTTSTAVGISASITTSGGNILVNFGVQSSVVSHQMSYNVFLDGVDQGTFMTQNSTLLQWSSGWTILTGVSVASHTVAIYAHIQTVGDTGVIPAFAPITLMAQEI